MVDAVTTSVLADNEKSYIIHITNICDGTGESAVKKVDVSALASLRGGVSASTVSIQKMCWDIQGFTNVQILWDATANDVAAVLSGQHEADWTCAGGLRNPKSTGFTGDVLLTTVGNAIGDTYSITLWCQKSS